MINVGRFVLDGLLRDYITFAPRQQSPRCIELELGSGKPSRHVRQKQVSSIMLVLCILVISHITFCCIVSVKIECRNSLLEELPSGFLVGLIRAAVNASQGPIKVFYASSPLNALNTNYFKLDLIS